jgi:hypothetical protein
MSSTTRGLLSIRRGYRYLLPCRGLLTGLMLWEQERSVGRKYPTDRNLLVN